MTHWNRMGDEDAWGEYCARCGHGPLSWAELFEESQCDECGADLSNAEDITPGKERDRAYRRELESAIQSGLIQRDFKQPPSRAKGEG